jgi:hypothetical protein
MTYALYKMNMDAVKPAILATSKADLPKSGDWRLVEMLASKYPHLHRRYLNEEGFK